MNDFREEKNHCAMCVLKVYNLCVLILALWRTPWLSMTDGALMPLVNTGDFWLARTNSIPVSQSTPNYKGGDKNEKRFTYIVYEFTATHPNKKVWNALLLFHFFFQLFVTRQVTKEKVGKCHDFGSQIVGVQTRC